MNNLIPGQIVEPELVTIPEGLFSIGINSLQILKLSDMDEEAKTWNQKGFFTREQPQQAIILKEFRISKFPVTVKQFRKFLEDGAYQKKEYWTDAGWEWLQDRHRSEPDNWQDEKWTGKDDLPVIGVSWFEAVAYCNWLSKQTGRTYRLPTEAEWEKAAGGREGFLFPWGDEFNTNIANTKEQGMNKTHEVGRFSPEDESSYGCSEMGGNVSEWVMSQYKPYPYFENDGRNDLEGNYERVTRGGAWVKPYLRARTNARGYNDPDYSDTDLGFRCVCES